MGARKRGDNSFGSVMRKGYHIEEVIWKLKLMERAFCVQMCVGTTLEEALSLQSSSSQ